MQQRNNKPNEKITTFWKKIMAHNVISKGLESKIYRQVIQLSNQNKQTTQTKNGHFSKEDIRWLTNTWKDAQHHSLIEKCKSKLQWNITSHWSEWPSSKSLQTINAGKGVEKRECSCTIGGNVNCYPHYGRWYGDSLKN